MTIRSSVHSRLIEEERQAERKDMRSWNTSFGAGEVADMCDIYSNGSNSGFVLVK